MVHIELMNENQWEATWRGMVAGWISFPYTD